MSEQRPRGGWPDDKLGDKIITIDTEKNRFFYIH